MSLRSMVKLQEPTMSALLETKLGAHKHFIEVLKFDSQIQSAATGLSDIIVIMWKKDVLKLNDIFIT